MKKLVGVVCAAAVALTLAACSGTAGAPSATDSSPAQTQESVFIKPSPDKYTWYIKDYVGMNAASIGYEALDGFRRDQYGNGIIKVIYVSDDGTYVDPGNEEQLKEYVVTAQNLEPNTEMKYVYEVDSNGEEYENLINFQTIDEIVLAVSKTGGSSQTPELTEIQPSPDKYTHYVRDYVGRNLAECGYNSLSGRLTDAYGHGHIFFDIVTDDGSFVDPEDEAALAGYMVTSQSASPNTAISMTYSTDSDGKEYSNLISSQTLESITLNVTKAPDSGYPVGEKDDEAVDESSVENDASADTLTDTAESTGDFRSFMDSYETFMNEYVDFMVTYNNSTDTSGMLSDYADMMARYADMAEQLDEIDESDLSADDYAYYIEVMGRVAARMAEIGQ